MRLNRWYKQIRKADSDAEQFLEQRRQILTNEVTLSAAVLTVLFCLTDFATSDYTLFLPGIAIIVYNLFCFLLSANGWSLLSRHLFCAGINILIFAISRSAGSHSGVQLMLLPVMAFSLIIFDLKKYFHSSFCIATSLVMLFMMEQKQAVQQSNLQSALNDSS